MKPWLRLWRLGVRPNSVAFGALVEGYERGGAWRPALALARHGVREAAAAVAQRLGRWRHGLRLLELSTVAAHGAALGGRQWRQAAEVVAQLRAKQLEATQILYNATIQSCGSAWRMALGFLEALRADRLAPDVVTHELLVGGGVYATVENLQLVSDHSFLQMKDLLVQKKGVQGRCSGAKRF